MAGNETIGRMTCPVCGEPLQDVRISKNGKLYMICDNNCRVNFTGKQSKQWLPLLRAGQGVSAGNITITTLTGGNNGTNGTIRTNTIGNAGQSVRTAAIGRPNGQYTGTGTNTVNEQRGQSAAGTGKPTRGIFADFFDDDE